MLFDNALEKLKNALRPKQKEFTNSSKVYKVYYRLYKSLKVLCWLPTWRHEHAGDRLLLFIWGAIFSSKSGKKPQARKFFPCSWNIRSKLLPRGISEKTCQWIVLGDQLNRGLSQLQVSIFLHPFDRCIAKLNHQKWEDPRQPQARYRIHSSVASACKIENRLY